MKPYIIFWDFFTSMFFSKIFLSVWCMVFFFGHSNTSLLLLFILFFLLLCVSPYLTCDVTWPPGSKTLWVLRKILCPVMDFETADTFWLWSAAQNFSWLDEIWCSCYGLSYTLMVASWLFMHVYTNTNNLLEESRGPSWK